MVQELAFLRGCLILLFLHKNISKSVIINSEKRKINVSKCSLVEKREYTYIAIPEATIDSNMEKRSPKIIQLIR